MNNMEYLRRLNRQFERGIEHGLKGLYRPGFIFGIFRQQYEAGQKQGLRIRPQPTKNKADLS